MGETIAELRDGLPEISLPDTVQAEYELMSCYQDVDKKQTYLVRRKEDNRKMVLKCAQGEYLAFLREEAAFFRDRKFSFLPCYISYYEHGGKGFLFREYIEGSTIWDIVERRGAFPQKEALIILKKLAGMLKMLHEENPPVIHRDLKPQNIVMTTKGECYLIDMGTARQYADDKPQEDYTPLGELPLRKPETDHVSSDGIAVIGQIESMEQMTLYGSNIASLQVFKRLSKMKYLDVWGNNLKNLDGLENMPDITHLDVGENPITRIEISPQIHLNFLGIRNSGVNDLSFLMEMPELSILNINYIQKQLLDEIMPEPPFRVNVSD